MRGLTTMRGGPRLMDLSLADFLDVVWAHILTPPPMADAHEWRETMFCWFVLGHEPKRISEYDVKTRRRTSRLAPRESQVSLAAEQSPAERIARGADKDMERLRARHEANREIREAKRRQVAEERLRAAEANAE